MLLDSGQELYIFVGGDGTGFIGEGGGWNGGGNAGPLGPGAGGGGATDIRRGGIELENRIIVAGGGGGGGNLSAGSSGGETLHLTTILGNGQNHPEIGGGGGGGYYGGMAGDINRGGYGGSSYAGNLRNPIINTNIWYNAGLVIISRLPTYTSFINSLTFKTIVSSFEIIKLTFLMGDLKSSKPVDIEIEILSSDRQETIPEEQIDTEKLYCIDSQQITITDDNNRIDTSDTITIEDIEIDPNQLYDIKILLSFDNRNTWLAYDHNSHTWIEYNTNDVSIYGMAFWQLKSIPEEVWSEKLSIWLNLCIWVQTGDV